MALENIDLSKFRRPTEALRDHLDHLEEEIELKQDQKLPPESRKGRKKPKMEDFLAPEEAEWASTGGNIQQERVGMREEAIGQASWTLREERQRLQTRLNLHEDGTELLTAEEIGLIRVRLGILEGELGDLAKVAIAEGHLSGKTERERLLAVGGIGCMVCGHEERLKVDAALLEGSYTIAQIGRLFGVTKRHLKDHLERHLLPIVEYSGALSRVAVGLKGLKETVGRLDYIQELALKGLETAVEGGEKTLGKVPEILDSLTRAMELRGKLKGELVGGTGGGQMQPNGGNNTLTVGVQGNGTRVAVMMVPGGDTVRELTEGMKMVEGGRGEIRHEGEAVTIEGAIEMIGAVRVGELQPVLQEAQDAGEEGEQLNLFD